MFGVKFVKKLGLFLDQKQTFGGALFEEKQKKKTQKRL